jgi:peroxiredoxin
MKKVVLGLMIIVVLASCKEKKYGAFVVAGRIEHSPSNKVYLEELPFGGEQPVILDSTTLKANGNFELRALGKEEGLYMIAIENGPEVLLINDNKSIKLKLDVQNYKAYTTEGSDATAALHNFLEEYTKQFAGFVETFNKADSLEKVSITDSAATVINLQKDNQLRKLNDFISATVTNSPSPALRFFVIGKSFKTMQPEDIKKLTDASAEKFKNHAGLQKMKGIIDMQFANNPKFALISKPAPEFTLADTSGKMIALNSFKGKYVLVDFWASWCKPCRQENPNVVAAYKKFGGKNFTVLGVSLDNDKDAWKQAIAQDSLTWTHVSDLKQWESIVVPMYKIQGIPFNVLLDPTGKIIAVELRGQALEAKLKEVLK